jgi:SAM-dependent methyltransferase
MKNLALPPLEDVPMMDQFLAAEGLHNYEMDRHTRLIYHPIYGHFFRYRFVMALEMLRSSLGPSAGRIVEVGYSAGLLLPTLSGMARSVIGVDTIASRAASAVQEMLHKRDIFNVGLLQGSAIEMPLTSGSVDALLCLSVLEHLQPNGELHRAAEEIERVLLPGGVAVLGFPVKNKYTRVLLKVAGVDEDEVHPSSHRNIVNAFRLKKLVAEHLRHFPGFMPLDLGMYALLQVRKPRCQ